MAVLAGAASAQTRFLTGPEFRAWTEGYVVRTDFADGTPFGVEEFGRNGTVVWREADGSCQTGRWREQGGSICYHYLGGTELSCLRYQASGEDLIGYQWNNDQGSLGFTGIVLRLTRTDAAPAGCNGVPVS